MKLHSKDVETFSLLLRDWAGAFWSAPRAGVIRRHLPSHKGMTLIEVILYIVLLSFLLAGFIQYAYTIHFQNIQLIYDIQDAQN